MSLRDRLLEKDLVSDGCVADLATAVKNYHDRTYSTYIVGDPAVLQTDMIDALRFGIAHYRPSYVSLWRVLHIDGFEPSFRLVRYRFSVQSFTRKAQPAV